MKLKVCGMRDEENINQLLALDVDYMGLIFYDKSKRYVQHLSKNLVEEIALSNTVLVGVFVNATEDEILEKSREFQLEYIQLHGEEPVGLGLALKKHGLKLIKVFSIENELPQKGLNQWMSIADFFLFDTKTPLYGGSGKKFKWDILKNYVGEKPFLLSGGVSLEDINEIMALNLPKLMGIDVNSKLELKPGLKNIKKIKELEIKLCS